MEDIAEVVGSGNRGGVATFLLEGGHLPPCSDGVGAEVVKDDGVFGDLFEVFHDACDVAEAGAALEKLWGEVHLGGKRGAGSIEWWWNIWRRARGWSGKDVGCGGTEGHVVKDLFRGYDGSDVWRDYVWARYGRGLPPLIVGR